VDDDSDLVEAFLAASRVLVAISVRSVDAAEPEVTLAQHRIMVLLRRGPQRIGDLAADLRVDPSVATRHCDRLERVGLVERRRDESDRRAVQVSLTAAGTARLDRVTAARRTEVAEILTRMPPEERAGLLGALRSFSAAAGEPAVDPPASPGGIGPSSEEPSVRPGAGDGLHHGGGGTA
jgi:DNA-binding MarR family transcriptional regulator